MWKVGQPLLKRPSPIFTFICNGRFIPPGSYHIPFSERFDEEGNRRPPPHPETPKFRDELPPATGPKIADKRPFRFICEPKKIYWWCACGQSKEQPFCDGHHARSVHNWPSRNQKPMFKPIKVVFEKKTELRLLGQLVKGGQRYPFCAVTRCYLPWRRKFFSFLRKKKNNEDPQSDKTKSQSEGTHAELIWAEASKNFKKNKLIETQQTVFGLKHSQLKQLKKSAFLDTVELYKVRSGSERSGFNDFILAALREMRAYEVADDLEAYKALLSVLPRGGRLKAKSFLHADLGAYKQQQHTAIQLLAQLNTNQVMPDDDVGNTIVEVFGFRSLVMSYYRRMMYWVPKLRHANPWPVVEKLPDDMEGEEAISLAQLVAARMCPDPATEFTTIVTDFKQNNLPCYIVSAQSPIQRGLLSAYVTTLAPSQPRVLYLDGPQFVWYRNLQLAYYVLWGHLDKHRIEMQTTKCQEVKDRLDSITNATSWDYPIPGSEKEKFIPLPSVLPEDNELPSASSPKSVLLTQIDGESDNLISLRPKKSSLTRRGNVMTAERRRALWVGFGPSHQLTHLPEDLTRHEQVEGTVLVVGVVAPVSNALENQALAYGGESSKELPDPTVSLPLPAPAELIQQWLKKLREFNPALDKATVIIRNRSDSNSVEGN